MTFEEWLQLGIDAGFCTDQYCAFHSCPPLSPAEEALLDEDEEICYHVVRLGSPKDWLQ
jgi:hypothetical protein